MMVGTTACVVLRRDRIFSRHLRRGVLATAPKYSDFVSRQILRKELLHAVPDVPMVVLVGSRQVGKTFSMSHAMKLRKNAIFLGVERELAGDAKGEWTRNKVLCYVYDEASPKVFLGKFSALLPAWFDLPLTYKVVAMRSIIRGATVKNCENQLPTFAFDVHSNSDIDAKSFMEALKVLNETLGVRTIIAASEGSNFANTQNDRWTVVEVKEASRDVAEKFLEKVDEKDVLIRSMPRTAGALTVRGSSEMLVVARRCTTRFLTAFNIACKDEDRKTFAEQALKGFGDPRGTALGELFKEHAGGSNKVDEWFHNRFVATNVMTKYGDDEFQFEATRCIAQLLVNAGGNINELKKQLKKDEWPMSK